ncbi:MAG: FAD-binding oxidoreductase [Dehalobacterium sp.]
MNRDQLMQHLIQIAGVQHVTSGPHQIQAHGFLENSRPEVIVFPGNQNEVEKIVLFAWKNEIPLVPVGGGSSIKQVLTPFQRGIGVSLTRLNRVQELEPENLSVRVEAGVLNRDLQEMLRTYNLFLPVFSDGIRSTIGGEVAADTGTRKRYRYGSMSDYVLGVEFVSPQGWLVKTGGKTVKNASGYDLTKLLAGSWGTIGIITAVTLKLKPVPEDELIMLVGFNSMVQAVQAAQKIRDEKLAIVSLDLRYNSCFKGETLDAPVKAVLQVALEGSKEVVAAHGKLLQQLFSSHSILRYDNNEGISQLWDSFHSSRHQIKTGCYGLVAFDKREINQIAGLLIWLAELDAAVVLDIGTGVLEFSLGDRTGELTEEFMHRLNELREKLGLEWKTNFDPLEENPLAERVLAGIDPRKIMFPVNAILRSVNRG